MYDMFIGGVSGTMEPTVTTALRELGEELGLGPCANVSISSVEDRGGFRWRKVRCGCVFLSGLFELPPPRLVF